MAERSTFIKIDRNIVKWRWYKDPNTFRLFTHLLIHANIEPHDFQKITINRGELATSYARLAQDLGLSVQNIRTALEHLKSTGEITSKKYSKFQVISIVNYNRYQDKPTRKSTGNQHSSNKQLTVNQQQLKNNKNNKEQIKNNSALAPEAHRAEEYPEKWYEWAAARSMTIEEYAKWRNQ